MPDPYNMLYVLCDCTEPKYLLEQVTCIEHRKNMFDKMRSRKSLQIGLKAPISYPIPTLKTKRWNFRLNNKFI